MGGQSVFALDEVTNGLDSDTALQVFQALLNSEIKETEPHSKCLLTWYIRGGHNQGMKSEGAKAISELPCRWCAFYTTWHTIREPPLSVLWCTPTPSCCPSLTTFCSWLPVQTFPSP